MNVCLLTGTFLPNIGGVEIGLHNIATRLQRLGHEPTVVCNFNTWRRLRKTGWELPYRVLPLSPAAGTLLARFPGLFGWLTVTWMRWLSRRYAWDVWHVTGAYPGGVVASLFRRRFGLPYIVRCPGSDIQTDPEIGYGIRLDPRIDALVREHLPKAPAVVAMTPSIEDEYAQLGIPPERVWKIPNGVDGARFRTSTDHPGIRESLGVASDEFLFLSVGRNHPKKGFRYLVEAGRLMHEQGIRGFRILIVGRNVTDLDLEDRDAEFLILREAPGMHDRGGGIPAIPPDELVSFYRTSNAFVLPSLVESFGIVLVEAMAAGLSIVTTDSPGCRDLVQDGENGLLVTPADALSLADSMHRMMTDAHLRDRLAETGEQRAKSFDWDDITETYASVYTEVRKTDG